MASFTTRVELHDGDADYDNLHEAMERKGFLRHVEGTKGTYRLPDAEYDLMRMGCCEGYEPYDLAQC